MISFKTLALAAGLGLALAASPLPVALLSAPASASDEIKYVVNDIPITSYDIQRRAAFLKLQNRKGNLNALASDDMIEQALRMSEARRAGVRISDDAVSEAFGRFAASNKMTVKQMSQVMQQAGVTAAHFKDFIRSQMAWGQVMSARGRKSGGNQEDAVRKMLQQGGTKPTATEYMLQQVIFVVPAKERGNMAKRKREAEAMRARFSSCDTTRQFAQGLLDVTVRDLGRYLAPELPPEWAAAIKKTQTGSATPVQQTERGVEFIGVCSSREVSDDRVARLAFQSQGGAQQGAGADEERKYLDELRKKARIIQR